MPDIWRYFIAILAIGQLFINDFVDCNDEISDHIHKCCASGIKHAQKLSNCGNYDYEIATIPPLWRGLCYSTYGVCCSRQLVKQHCTAGREAALLGSRCDEKFNTTSYADCCRSCQVGLAVKASNHNCNDILFSYFEQIESYRICCSNINTDSSESDNDIANVNESIRKTEEHIGDDDDDDNNTDENANDGTIVLQDDDDDICGKVPNLCAHICENTKEEYRCKCHSGYKLDSNNVTCSPLTSDDNFNPDKPFKIIYTSRNTSRTGELAEDLPGNIDNEENDAADDDDDDTVKGNNGVDNKLENRTCTVGYEHNPIRRRCVDIDECRTKINKCRSNQYCHNTDGGYRCLNIKHKNCENGYRFNASTEKCEDIDECEEKLDNCTLTEQCINTKGKFQCNQIDKCKTGFVYAVDAKECVDYNECNDLPCKDGYVCENFSGWYECKEGNDQHIHHMSKLSNSANPLQSNTCRQGFQMKYGRCVDIDECVVDNFCDSSQVCTNDIGGYHCDCKIGFNLDSTTNACIDINECSINNHNCLPSQRCDNTVGSYVCTRLQSCGTGYTLNAETANCDDDDECALETHNCPPDYACYNTKGSFRCYRRPSSTTTTSTTTTTTTTTTSTPSPPVSYGKSYHFQNGTLHHPPITYVSQQTHTNSHLYDPHYISTIQKTFKPCEKGFSRNHMGACVDVNECLLKNACGSHQRCINTNGSYRCQNLLKCQNGFRATPEGTFCVDIDECETGEHNCANTQICRNRNGGYICSCPPGHQFSHGSSRCLDIDECEKERPSVCPSNAQCQNTIGSYYCECKSGFQKSRDSDRICLDVDECQEIPGLCQQKCVNFWGGYRCTCNTGFELSADNRTCNDVDECEVHKSYRLCMGFCNNVPGSYECSCPRGYKLSMDKTTCRDIDECETGEFCTGHNDICTNTRGSYRCTTIHCPNGYVNDIEQRNRCRLIQDLCEGDECYNKPSAYTYNFITLVSKLVIPPEGRVIFSLRGPSWYDDIDFDLKIIKIQGAANIEKASDNHFDTIKSKYEVNLLLKRMLEGPQDIELELNMTVFTKGMPRGKSVAKIFILVSQYTF